MDTEIERCLKVIDKGSELKNGNCVTKFTLYDNSEVIGSIKELQKGKNDSEDPRAYYFELINGYRVHDQQQRRIVMVRDVKELEVNL